MSLVEEWVSKQHFMQPQHSICVAIMCLKVEADPGELEPFGVRSDPFRGRLSWKESTVNSLLHDACIEQLSQGCVLICLYTID